MKRTIAASSLGVVTTIVALAQANPRAAETCSRAHALFVTGDGASADRDLQRIRGLLTGARGKYHFEVVDDEPDAVHKIQLKTYSVTGSQDLKAVVGHCSHGGTCNQAADLVAAQNMGTPHVYCGPSPQGLE